MAVDKYFVGGVNHVFWHGTNYSPQNETWPGWLFYAAVHFTPANSFWKDFGTLNNYVARCQSFLQRAKPDNDVLVYFPIADKFSEGGNFMLQHFDGMKGFEQTGFNKNSEYLLEHGYAFDFVSDKQIVEQLSNSGNAIQSSKHNYQTILIPNVKFLPLETLDKLIVLAKNGATILVYKNLPKNVPGYGGLKQKQEAYDKRLQQINFSKENNVLTATVGKGKFIIDDNLQMLLDAATIRKETMLEQGLQYNRRSTTDGHTYFIANKSGKPFDGWVELAVKENNVVLYNPMTLKTGITKTEKFKEGITKVYLQLNTGESCILQTGNKQLAGNKYPYQKVGEAITLENKWNINFVSGGPTLPAAVSNSILGSWTNLDGNDVKIFSGTASYTTHFNKPKANAVAYLIDLGKVEESAEVFINGNRIATLLGPVYQLTIPSSQLKENNLLEVKVTNGMANRIADLDKCNIVWKKFYNTNFPARKPENRDANGLFTAGKWQPKPSGLFGPVTIATVTFIK